MTLPYWPAHDPGNDWDYSLDYLDFLQTGEYITNSSWAVPPDFTIVFSSIGSSASGVANSLTTVWLTGGTYGEIAVIQNTIETSLSRTEVRSVMLPVIPN